jgi:hypothetical protein
MFVCGQDPEPEYNPGKTARDEERERLEEAKELREGVAAGNLPPWLPRVGKVLRGEGGASIGLCS